MRNPEERCLHREMVALLHDGSLWISSKKELANDLKTFSRRFSHEGLSFLTKTLPLLGKAIDMALSGNVTFNCPSAFRRDGNSAFPKFLGSALRLIFDDEGYVHQVLDPALLRWVRTFCMFAYKVEVPFREEQIQSFSDSFFEVDDEVEELSVDDIDDRYRNVMRNHLNSILKGYCLGSPADGPGISSDVPRHAKRRSYVPESKVRNHFGRDFFHQVSEYKEREQKLYLTTKVRRMHPILRFLEGFGHVFGILQPEPSNIELGFSKVLFVPKDSRGPRVIACEPSAHMFAQQAVRNGIYDAVENSPLTRGRVNFTDQTVNQKLTFDSSNATLDLKEASDRVSYSLVADLFPSRLFLDMDACRTSIAVLPDGRTRKLSKFAPMGNALCFPTMALLAYTSVCSAIYLHGGPLPSQQTSVYVYGDDIIVPNTWASVAIEALESVGLLVNKNKSFVNSRFRESCGQDTFDQSTVTPLRKRKLQKGVLRRMGKGKKVIYDDDGYAMHAAAVMNQAVELGFINLAITVEENLSKYLRSPIPFGTIESSYICHHVSDSDIAWRLNEARGYSHNGKLRAYVFKDSDQLVDHTPYSRLRSSFRTSVCPISGDNTPSYLKLGTRRPQLQIRTLKKHWIGSFV